MKEVLGSLPEVITAYKNYNLLVPTAILIKEDNIDEKHSSRNPV